MHYHCTGSTLVCNRNCSPALQENLDDLSEPMRQLATVISAIKSDLPPNILWDSPYLPGRPRKSRQAILNAFIAKAIFNIPTTRDLIERLRYDKPGLFT